jgi:hypothetical protein
MMLKNNLDNVKEPELMIDGKKIPFHTSRKERLALKHETFRTNHSFFSKRNRYIHILLIDMLIIFIIGMVFMVMVGKAKRLEINGIQYYFSTKIFLNSPNIDFNLQIKNITRELKVLDEEFRTIFFYILDQENKSVYEQNVYIAKNRYQPKQDYQEFFFIKKNDLNPGKYHAIITIGENSSKQMQLNFSVK